MLHRIECESIAAAAQRVVAATSFQCEITAARACVFAVFDESLAGPLLKLVNRHGTKRRRTRTKTGERCFDISLGDLIRQCDDA